MKNRSLTAQSAPDWDRLFLRKSGWTGGDGIYSIPLSGGETWTGGHSRKTLLLFGDTFICKVDDKNTRHNNIMINNSYAILKGNRPHRDNIVFRWGLNHPDQPDAAFKPLKADAEAGQWFWLMDGISLASKIYIFALRLEENPEHIFNFRIKGVSLIKTSLGPSDTLDNYSQAETPLFYKAKHETEDIVFGQGIMDLTEHSGNPDPDGYLYMYGPRGSLTEKELMAARVKPEDIDDFSRWRFWNSRHWSKELSDSAPITDGISQEFSVSPLGGGRFILVFLKEKKVGIRIGECPAGPFGEIQYIWTCREADGDPDIYVYNAKAHPHLSKPGTLLISYNVNCHTLERHDIEADLYRPRFIKLNVA